MRATTVAGDRGVEVADGLGRLDLAARRRRRSTSVADVGQGDVDDVAERVLRVVGDADAHRALGLAGAAHPLVLAGVLQVLGVHGRSFARSVRGAGVARQATGPAGLGVLRCRGLATRGDLDLVGLLELDRAVAPASLHLSMTPPVKSSAAARSCGLADRLDDVRRAQHLAVDLDAAVGVLEARSGRRPGPSLSWIASAPASRSSSTASSSCVAADPPVGRR